MTCHRRSTVDDVRIVGLKAAFRVWIIATIAAEPRFVS